MRKHFEKNEDFIGVYHPFPHERKSRLKKDDSDQLDLFTDYCPPKESWWKRLIIEWKRKRKLC